MIGLVLRFSVGRPSASSADLIVWFGVLRMKFHGQQLTQPRTKAMPSVTLHIIVVDGFLERGNIFLPMKGTSKLDSMTASSDFLCVVACSELLVVFGDISVGIIHGLEPTNEHTG